MCDHCDRRERSEAALAEERRQHAVTRTTMSEYVKAFEKEKTRADGAEYALAAIAKDRWRRAVCGGRATFEGEAELIARAEKAEARVKELEGLLQDEDPRITEPRTRGKKGEHAYVYEYRLGLEDAYKELRRKAGLDKPEPAKPATDDTRKEAPTHKCNKCGQWLRLTPCLKDTAIPHDDLPGGPCAGALLPQWPPPPQPPPAAMLICLTCRKAITTTDEQGKRTGKCTAKDGKHQWVRYAAAPDEEKPVALRIYRCEKCGMIYPDKGAWLGLEWVRAAKHCAIAHCGGSLIPGTFTPDEETKP